MNANISKNAYRYLREEKECITDANAKEFQHK